MDQKNQGESSSGVPSAQLGKRKRGRPCKDPSRKPAQHAPPQIADHPAAGIDPMVGQAVTGVVEGTFDAGYVLSVKIGDSNLRGIVFKPGHYVPITAENDVAPFLPMLMRNGVPVPPAKRRTYTRRKTGGPSAPPPPVVERGKLVPVVLQPVNLSNGSPHTMENEQKDVKVAVSLSTLPTMGTNNVLCTESTTSEVGQGENVKPVLSDIDAPSGSLQTPEIKIENDMEGVVLEQGTGSTKMAFTVESLEAASVAKPFFSYGTGNMTELLKENVKEKVQIAAGEALESKVEFHEETATDDGQEKAP